MKKIICRCMIAGAILLAVLSRTARTEQPPAAEIIKKMDAVMNAPKDQEKLLKVLLIDKKGKEKSREMSLSQKGSEKRIVKFLSPADQRGIGFLSLPNDMMYLYLPAFKKVRRIASHVKNSKFAGTDFTYEDMEAVRYDEKMDFGAVKTENGLYVLDGKLKPGRISDYSRSVLWVDAKNFHPSRIELYGKTGKLIKTLTMDKVEQVNGFWVSREMTMEDVRTGHKTKMILVKVKFNSGLSDDLFTERYLSR